MSYSLKENILVTGASGFVGRALIKKLAKKNNLFLVSKDKNFYYPDAKVFYGDLSNAEFCKKIVKKIDTVFYLAGYKKNIEYHAKCPNDFVVKNIQPLIIFLNAVKNSSIKKIIYLSSVNVNFYKKEEKDGYVVGKYINELILKSFRKQFRVDIKIVRSCGVYGPGDNFDLKTANFIPAIINKALNNKKEIIVWGNGKRQLQFIYIDDLISNIIAISHSKETFFVIGNLEKLTINEIVNKIIKLTKKNLTINYDKAKQDKNSQLVNFNNKKKPKFNLDKGLKKTIKHYQDKLQKK